VLPFLQQFPALRFQSCVFPAQATAAFPLCFSCFRPFIPRVKFGGDGKGPPPPSRSSSFARLAAAAPSQLSAVRLVERAEGPFFRLSSPSRPETNASSLFVASSFFFAGLPFFYSNAAVCLSHASSFCPLFLSVSASEGLSCPHQR